MESGGATPPTRSSGCSRPQASTGAGRIVPPLPAAGPAPVAESVRRPLKERVQRALNGGQDQRAGVPGAVRNGAEAVVTTQELGPVSGRGQGPDTTRLVVSTQPPAAAPTRPQPAAAQVARPVVRPGQPRQARLRLKRVDPWSVFKTALLLSIAFGIVTIVSVLIVWSVLGAAGVWDSVNATVQSVVGGQDGTTFQVEDYVGMQRVVGFTMLVSVIDVFLLTAIATLSAFLYNMAAALLGGLEVTLVEDN